MAFIDNKAWRQAALVFGRMSGWVATPVVAALLLGRWLDSRHGSGNFWFFVIIGAGFFVSVYGIYREARKYQRSLDAEERTQKKTQYGHTDHN